MSERNELLAFKPTKVYGLEATVGGNCVFVFFDKEKAEKFLANIKLYVPEFKMDPHSIKDLEELTLFTSKEQAFVFTNPVVIIEMRKGDKDELSANMSVRIRPGT